MCFWLELFSSRKMNPLEPVNVSTGHLNQHDGACTLLKGSAKPHNVVSFVPQVIQSVWDISHPFKAILVNGSKFNTEETAKVSKFLPNLKSIFTGHFTRACERT